MCQKLSKGSKPNVKEEGTEATSQSFKADMRNDHKRCFNREIPTMICCQVKMKCILLISPTFGGSPKGKLIVNYQILTAHEVTSFDPVCNNSSECLVQNRGGKI